MKTLKSHFYRILLHAVYIVFASIAGFVGVFWIGVPAVGDNPGAVHGGVLPFLAIYFGCIVGESFIHLLAVRKETLPRAILDACIAVIAAAFASVPAATTLWSLSSVFSAGLIPVATSVLIFLILEALLRLGAERALAKSRFKSY